MDRLGTKHPDHNTRFERSQTSDNQSQCAKQKLDLNPSLYQNFFGLILTPACQCILLLLPETSLPAVSQPQVLKAEHEGFRSPLVRRQIQSHQLETLARSAVAVGSGIAVANASALCTWGADCVWGQTTSVGRCGGGGRPGNCGGTGGGSGRSGGNCHECSISW